MKSATAIALALLLTGCAAPLLLTACAEPDSERFAISDVSEPDAAQLRASRGYRYYRISEIGDAVTCYRVAHEGATRVEVTP